MDLTTYFKNSLIDSERYATRYADISHRVTSITLTQLRAGKIPEEQMDVLYDYAETEQNHEIEVLINPLLLQNPNQEEQIAPLWVPALLHSSGRLTPHYRDIPWISINYLAPSRTGDVSIGHLDKYEAFYQEHSLTFTDWKSYWTFTENLFIELTGQSFDNFKHDSYKITGEGSITVKPAGIGEKEGLVSVLTDLENMATEERPHLYNRMCHLKEREKKQLTPPDAFSYQHPKHLGHMSSGSPLSASQRQALYHFFEEEDGTILAVNGPPGTGKSMMLNCITASLWVCQALKQAEPPFLTATAIDHVTSLDLAHQYPAVHHSLLEKRWIPELTSYSLYASIDETKENGISSYFIDGTSDFQQKLSDPVFKDKAEKVFLETAEDYLQTSVPTAEDAVSLLHKKLVEVTEEMKQVFGFINRGEDDRIQEWMKEQTGEKGTIDNLLSYLDTNHRYQAFFLASHYWEGRWLMDSELKGNLIGDQKSISKLTPLIVIPSYHLPYFFLNENHPKAYEQIDYLMLEEAGQMLPEVAATNTAFAKNVLAIGDTNQAKPLWNITETFDMANIKNCQLTADVSSIIKCGLTASSGSALRIAQRQSSCIVHRDIGGMFLTEHRRSVPEIISFCDNLTYNGWLRPIRPSLDDYPLPHFGYIHIAGYTRKHSSGLSNKAEALAIIEWILDNQETLKSYYNESQIEKLIAVVTPFVEQKEQIEQFLLQRGLESIKVGTIHMMQGASSPVVLFSSVYQSGDHQKLEFDKDPSLLNVAVSRAKESFQVFGDRKIYEPARKTPSGLLARFLFNE